MIILNIVEATWEKRNIGVTCTEIEIEKNDSLPEILNAVAERTEQYIVVKILHGRTDVLFALQDLGFHFIETLFTTEVSLKEKPVFPAVCSNLIQNISYHVATPEDQRRVLDEVKSGRIFSTDRIALDPDFSNELAGQRYAFWIEDIMAKEGSKMIITEYENKSIGFNVFATKGKICEGLIGGLFFDYLDSGLGFANNYAGLLAGHDFWGTKTVSHVSSNNFQMFKLHLFSGMNIKSLVYVLIKHNKRVLEK